MLQIYKYLIEEWNSLLEALRLYTILPVPFKKNFSIRHGMQSIRYFIVVGVFVALIASFIVSIIYYISHDFILATMCLLGSCIILTGTLHEDGLADVCDAFGGAHKVERGENQRQLILDIMKDHQLGVYGVLGLIFMLSFKFYFIFHILKTYLREFTGSRSIENIEGYVVDYFFIDDIFISLWWEIFLLILLYQIWSRLGVTSFFLRAGYISGRINSKYSFLENYKIPFWFFFILVLLCCLPLLYFESYYWILIAISWIPLRLLLDWVYYRKLGGYTGDCLGAAQQGFELITLMVMLIILKIL